MANPYYVDGAVSPEFAKLLLGLAETLGVRLAETRYRAYAKLLGDVPWPDLCRACEAAANESVKRGQAFFPSPGELRGLVGPTTDDAALMAWAGLERLVREHGTWWTIELEDTAAAMALLRVWGSWPAFCAEPDGPGLAIRRQEFLAAYRQARREPRRDPVRLPGTCEISGEMSPHALITHASASWDVRVVHDARRLRDGDSTALARQGSDARAGEGAEEASGTAGRPGRPPGGRAP